ncbi:hypothetical protein I546_7156 [Mycobacterium kansasii 732]|nr:hypothetical protein I546_7156 [Mycobacterium kansasii 732]
MMASLPMLMLVALSVAVSTAAAMPLVSANVPSATIALCLARRELAAPAGAGLIRAKPDGVVRKV